MKQKTGRKLLDVLLALAMIIGLLPGMSLTALAWDGNPYADLVPTGSEDASALTAKRVTFNGKEWYVIKDESTAENAGTLTLLYAGSLGNAPFDTNGSNVYANSSIKTALGNMTATGTYKGVADAIKDTANGKLYLLSVEEANQVPLNVRKDFPEQAWWLRTACPDGKVAYVYVAATDNPGRIHTGGVVPTTAVVGARPALQLDLSKVVYDAENKAFYIPATAPTNVTVTGATLVAGYGAGSVKVTATAAAGHTLSYQWYLNTTNSNEGGTLIGNATSATYNIPTGNAAGNYYYYCVVTATRTDNSQTARVTSPVATVTVAADTDELVAKLAEEKSIDLSQYYRIPAEDMYFTSGQYWIKGNVNGRSVDGDNSRVATKQFTKQGLPKNALIFCKAYYGFETVAWNKSTSSVKTETVGRRNHVFTTVGEQFSWWNDYELFGFNLTKYAEGDFNTIEEADLSSFKDAFRVYVPKGEAVAKIGGVSYYTLADAVRAAESGATIKLLRDATDNLVLTSGKNITLNLNDHTLTNDGRHCTIVAQNGSTLVVTGNGIVDNTTHQCAPLYNNGGTVTLNGGTFIRSQEAGNGNNSYYTVVNRGTMTINEGVIIGDGKVNDSSLIDNGYSEINRSGYREIDPNISYGYQGGESSEKAVLTVTGGTFMGGRHTLNNDVNGVATISGGDFSSSTGNAVYNVGELTISGGTFTAQAEGKFVLLSAAESGETYGPDSVSGTATVTGGTFNGKLQKDEGATIAISGGEFSEIVPEDCCAEGYQPVTTKNSNGKYTVTLPDSVVTTAPTPNELTFTGEAQELVTAGTAEGGTMVYALGTDAITAPAADDDGTPDDQKKWTTSIPTATDVGTYYVWYKVIGDESHANTDPASVEVTISPADKTALNAAIDSAAKYGDNIKDYSEIAATLNTAIEAARAVAANDNAAPDAIADAVTKLNTAAETAKAAVETAKNQAAAQAVIDTIKTLPESATLNDKAAVEAARKAYDALTDAQKALVPAETLKNLTDAETAIATAEATAADLAAAQAVTDAIKALSESATLNDKAAVEAARKAYDALTDAQKALVPADVLKKLTDAEAAIAAAEKAAADAAAAQAVTEAIKALPEPATLNDKAAVEAARKAYDALTDAQKALVPAETLKKLTDAEAAIAAAERISLRKCTITAQNRIYTGKAITPRVTVMYGDTKLKEGQDYTLSYKKVKSFQKVRVVVKGKGRFKGTRNAYFKIVPKGTAITKVSGGKKQFTVKWKKQKDITGFQIEYSLHSDFAKSKRMYIRSDKTLSATIGKLKAGRTYYVRVRTYHKRKNRLFFSAWTEAVAVNTNGAKANEARVINIAVNVGDELDLNALATGVTTWESSDEAVATVSAEGVAKALAAGEATFTGFDANGDEIKIVMLVSDSATLELEAIDLTDFGGGIVEDIDADEPLPTEEELELTLE